MLREGRSKGLRQTQDMLAIEFGDDEPDETSRRQRHRDRIAFPSAPALLDSPDGITACSDGSEPARCRRLAVTRSRARSANLAGLSIAI